MIGLIPKLPLYWSFRRTGWPKMYPFSVVISISYRCNSKCRTCDVWRKPNDDLTLEEWDKVFQKLGRTPVYMTFTGGEPFLRDDLDQMVISGYQHCQPEYITIPTNGLLTDRILAQAENIVRTCADAQIGLNLSLDGVGDVHDDIRGVPGNWDQSMETWRRLKDLQKRYPNLVLSVHTVVSRFNIHLFEETYEGLQKLQPDSYITEVAEERVELDTVGWGITPLAEQYAPVADFLSQKAQEAPAKRHRPFHPGLPRRSTTNLPSAPCWSKRRSSTATPAGRRARSAPTATCGPAASAPKATGNLRDTDYDIAPIWFGEEMARLRRSIADKECYCPMANASYANMLLHPPTLARAALDVVR